MSIKEKFRNSQSVQIRHDYPDAYDYAKKAHIHSMYDAKRAFGNHWSSGSAMASWALLWDTGQTTEPPPFGFLTKKKVKQGLPQYEPAIQSAIQETGQKLGFEERESSIETRLQEQREETRNGHRFLITRWIVSGTWVHIKRLD